MKRTFLPLIILIIAFVMASPLLANDRGGEFSISPFIGGFTFDGTQHLKSNVATGIRLGYNMDENWGVEGQFTFVPLESTLVDRTVKGDHYSLRGDVLYHFMPQNKIVPFVALGGGVSMIDDSSFGYNKDATLDYGAGVKYFFSDKLALRGDVRHIFSFHNAGTWQNLEYTVGLALQFGKTRVAIHDVKVEDPIQEVKTPVPAPIAMEPAPTPIQPPIAEPTQLILPGRLPTPIVPAPVPKTEPAPAPQPVLNIEGPTSWLAEKTELPEGKIMVIGMKIEQNSLVIMATEPIRDYKVFTLVQPSRLVIDINNGINGFRTDSILINRQGIDTVQLEDNPDYLRIILNSAQGKPIPYRILETDSGLKIMVTTPDQNR